VAAGAVARLGEGGTAVVSYDMTTNDVTTDGLDPKPRKPVLIVPAEDPWTILYTSKALVDVADTTKQLRAEIAAIRSRWEPKP
jgi:hypothetical protein